ncbi:hypothetical protein OX89_15320 [Diaphorobacter sp. J5-51]|nr:hypothetical protein OX89_15320 [Diaphorobacter sp. J5-51]
MCDANAGCRLTSSNDDVTNFPSPLLDVLFGALHQLPSLLNGAGQLIDVPLHITLLIGEVRNVQMRRRKELVSLALDLVNQLIARSCRVA